MASQLLRKSGIYLIGNAGTKLLGIVLIPIYAFFIAPADLGSFDLIITVAELATVVYFVAVWESIIRFAMARDGKYNPKQVVATAVVVGMVASLALAITAAGLILALGGHAEQVIGGALIAGLTGLLKVWQYSARASGQSKLFVASGLLQAAINLASVAVLICVLRWGLSGLLWSYVAGLVFALVLLEAKLHLLSRDWQWPPRALVKSVLRFTFPLMLNLISTALLSSFGRILITATLGPEANGQFAFAMRIALAVFVVGQVLSMASTEETVLRIGSPTMSSFYSMLLSSAWILMLAGGALTVVAAQVLFVILGDTDYASSFALIPALVLWGILGILATQYGNAFQVAQKTGIIAWTTLAGLIVSVTGSLLTVHRFGTIGVALSMVVAGFVTTFFRRHLAVRYIHFKESKMVLVAALLFAFVTAAALIPLPTPVTIAAGALGAIAAVVLFFYALRNLNRAPDAEPVTA